MSVRSNEVKRTDSGPVKVQMEEGVLQPRAAQAETQSGGKGYKQVDHGDDQAAKKEAVGRAQVQDFEKGKKK